MKYVYVAKMIDGEIIAVARKRKAIRIAIENRWHRTHVDRLVWRKGDWSPWRYMGTKLVPTGFVVEKFGVL
jgi:hypothetical protein